MPIPYINALVRRRPIYRVDHRVQRVGTISSTVP
jgi:hypothetical protein